MNPYSQLPDHCFWSRAVTWVHPAQMDPMSRAPFRITASDKIATMGSCFAQHISRRLQAAGFNYFVPESAPDDMGPDDAKRANYGVFSARYGNVYTVRQAVQLIDRAFDGAEFDEVWEKGSHFVDPFRPQIEPDGFETPEAVRQSRARHLAAVRRVFQESDVLVFTLGLTEAWRAVESGAVYPTAPGVAGGQFDPGAHAAVNFTVQETIADLETFIRKARALNPRLKFILTVSPVPLKATFEDRHVLQSTVYSKSVLRVAAQHASETFDDVCYFPSFEIITGPGGAGRYYAPDLREVRDVGVAHVMRIFERHFIRGEEAVATPAVPSDSQPSDDDIVCDEDLIDAAIKGILGRRAQPAAAPAGPRPTLSEYDVAMGYRMVLNRDPESSVAIDAHRHHHRDRSAFVATLLSSNEFKRRVGDDEAARMKRLFDWLSA